MMTSIQEGEDDKDITTSDTTTPSIKVQGPIMRSRALAYIFSNHRRD
jgi:hypothetical protein